MLGSYSYHPQILILSSTYSFFLGFDFLFSILAYSDTGRAASFVIDASAYGCTASAFFFYFYISFILFENSLYYGYNFCCIISYSLISISKGS
jgi:hypothetical protein